MRKILRKILKKILSKILFLIIILRKTSETCEGDGLDRMGNIGSAAGSHRINRSIAFSDGDDDCIVMIRDHL